jgi:hypothetical protein
MEILNQYGKDMTAEERSIIEDKWEDLYTNAMFYVRSGVNKDGVPISDGIIAGTEVTPGYPRNSYSSTHDLIPVYEVEWIEVDKDFVMQRYETVRIGEEVYILKGKNDKVIRSKSNPSQCTLSINGLYLLNRNYEPYSLALTCAP